MKFFHALLTCALAFVLSTNGEEGKVDVFIGTYTRGDSKGIYVSQLDLKTGALSDPTLAAEIENPSFLAFSPDEKFLYAVVETAKFKGQAGGGLAAFKVDGTQLTLLNTEGTGGGAPCHLSVDPTGKVVAVANYSGGNVAAFPVKEDGSIAPFASLIQHEGSSLNEKRQKGPHAHAINIFGKGKYAAAADLGTDSVFIYKLDSNAGLQQVSEIRLQPGSGARHIAFHPTEKFVYVINEMLLTVAAFKLKSETEWEPLQYVSTLPEGTEKIGSTAEIQMHPSGKFVYGSNRGHDTIACYSIDQEKGTLSLVEHEPIQGKIPRNFAITPDGKYLLAAGQKSDSVAVFTIDQKTGALDFTGKKIEVPSPVGIVFKKH